MSIALNSSRSNAEGVKPIPTTMKSLPSIMSSAGFIWGLYFAFNKESGFWGYVGYSLLGSVGGAVAGGLIKAVTYPSGEQNFSGADGKKKNIIPSAGRSCVCGNPNCLCKAGDKLGTSI